MRRLLLLLVPLVVVAVACGDDQSPGAAGADPSSSGSPVTMLDGRTFLSTGVAGHELVDGTVVRLSFEDGSLSANVGCNKIFGGYRLDGDVLTAEALAQTRMACEDLLMEQDTWLMELLMGSPTVALEADALVLTSADGSTVVTMQVS